MDQKKKIILYVIIGVLIVAAVTLAILSATGVLTGQIVGTRK